MSDTYLTVSTTNPDELDTYVGGTLVGKVTSGLATDEGEAATASNTYLTCSTTNPDELDTYVDGVLVGKLTSDVGSAEADNTYLTCAVTEAVEADLEWSDTTLSDAVDLDGAPLAWINAGCDSDGSHMIATSMYGRIYTSSDSGTTWTERRPSGVDDDMSWRAADIDADGSFLIVGEVWDNSIDDNGHLYISSNGGSSWTEVTPKGVGVPGTWRSAASDSDGSNLIVCETKSTAGGGKGRVYISSDSGSNWTDAQPTGVDENLNWGVVASDADGSVLLAGYAAGRLYLSIDSGSNWSEIQPAGNTTKSWIVCDMSADGSVIIVGGSGTLYLSTDTGTNWAEVQPNGATTPTWFDASVSSDGSFIAVCAQTGPGRVWVSDDTGTTWTEELPSGIDETHQWRGLGCDSDGSHLLACDANGNGYVGIRATATPAGEKLTAYVDAVKVLEIDAT